MSKFLLSKKSYLLYFVLILIFYWDTQNAGFVTDFLGWQTSFDNNNFWEIIHAADRGIKGFYHLTHLEMYALSSLFRTWGLPWFLVFTLLFALNAWFLTRFSLNLLTSLEINNKEWAVFAGVLCFVLSPYQAEVMVWRASFHYLTAFNMLLGFLVLLQRYLDKPRAKYAIYANLLFFSSLFALEFFFLTPILAFVLIVFYHFSNPKIIALKTTLARFVLLPLASLSTYFLLYHSTYGKWIAHYGAAAHSSLFTLTSFSTYAKYVVKHLFLIRYYHIFDYNVSLKTTIYGFFDQSIVVYSIVAIVSVFCLKNLIQFKKISPLSKFQFLYVILFSLFLVPVVSLFFFDLYLTENDRLGFMASAFLFVGVSVGLSNWSKHLFVVLMPIYLLVNIFFLIKTTQLWFKSERVYTNLVKTYRWWDADEVIVLNLPDNLNGMYLFRHRGATSALPETLAAHHQRKITTKMYDIKRYNLMDWDSGVNVTVDSANHLSVRLNQFGSWWFYEADKLNDGFEVKNFDNGFQVKLKPTTQKRAIIFQVGQEWREVDMTKIGEIQR